MRWQHGSPVTTKSPALHLSIFRGTNMAKVTVNMAFPAPVVHSYLLELSPDEARVLRVLTGSVGGHNFNTRRQHADIIWNALVDAGVLSLPLKDYVSRSEFFV